MLNLSVQSNEYPSLVFSSIWFFFLSFLPSCHLARGVLTSNALRNGIAFLFYLLQRSAAVKKKKKKMAWLSYLFCASVHVSSIKQVMMSSPWSEWASGGEGEKSVAVKNGFSACAGGQGLLQLSLVQHLSPLFIYGSVLE